MSITVIVILIYFVFIIAAAGVSSYWMNKRKTSLNFLVGNRTTPFIVCLCATIGVAMGGSQTVGIAQNVYIMGLAGLTYGIVRCCDYLLLSAFAAPIVRKLKMYNANEYFGAVFNKHDTVLFGIIGLIILVGTIPTQALAGAAILPMIFPEMTYQQGILICCIFFGILTFVGGFLTVGVTNIVNVVFIIGGLVICCIWGLIQVGGLSGLAEMLPDNTDAWLNYTTTPTRTIPEGTIAIPIITIIAYVCSTMIQGMVAQTEWQCMSAAKTARESRIVMGTTGIVQFVMAFVVALVGLIGVARYPDLETQASALYIAAESINPVIGAVVIASVFAAVASTGQTVMLAGSSVLTGMISHLKPDIKDKSKLLAARIFVLVLIVVGYWLCTKADNIITWSTNVLAFMPPFSVLWLLSVYKPKYCRKNSATILFCGVIVAAAIYIIFDPVQAFFTHIAFPALIATAICIPLAMVMDKRPIDLADAFENPQDPHLVKVGYCKE